MERSGPIPSAFRQAGWSCGSGTGGAPTAAARRRRRWTAAGYMYVLICTCIHWVSECAQTQRLPPTSPSLPADGGLAGRTAAAAGPCWTCWLPRGSRILCSVAVSGVTFLAVPDLSRNRTGKKTGMERSGRTTSALRRADSPCGSGTGGAPTAAARHRRRWTAAGYLYVIGCGCICAVSECAPTRRLPTSQSLAEWPGVAGKEGPARQFLSSPSGPWQLLRWRLARKDCCCSAAAGYLKNVLLRLRLGCYVADCA